MIRVEAIIVALIGALVGLLLGVFLGIVSVSAIPQFATISIPGGSMFVFFVVAGILLRRELLEQRTLGFSARPEDRPREIEQPEYVVVGDAVPDARSGHTTLDFGTLPRALPRRGRHGSVTKSLTIWEILNTD